MNTLLLRHALAQPSPKQALLRGVRPGVAPPTTPEESTLWDERSLRQLVGTRLPGAQIIVVSNRQPYSDHRQGGHGGQVRIEQAASGQYRLPLATVLSFWHIPWSHPEQMSQCPWLAELVDGLLGSDVVGFQAARHADHFFASALGLGRSVERDFGPLQTGRGQGSAVRDYAISIAWPGARAASAALVSPVSMARGASAAQRWTCCTAPPTCVG